MLRVRPVSCRTGVGQASGVLCLSRPAIGLQDWSHMIYRVEAGMPLARTAADRRRTSLLAHAYPSRFDMLANAAL